MRYLTRDIHGTRTRLTGTRRLHTTDAEPFCGGRPRGTHELGAACSNVALAEVERLREESATRSSDLRLFRLAAAPPTPTTLGREYGVSLCLDVQLNALRSCQAHTRVRLAARARLERGGSAQRVWAAALTASLVTRATCSARPEGDSN